MIYCNESSTIHFRHQHFRENNEGRGMFLQYFNNQRHHFTNEASTKTGCNVWFLIKKHVCGDSSGPAKQRERQMPTSQPAGFLQRNFFNGYHQHHPEKLAYESDYVDWCFLRE